MIQLHVTGLAKRYGAQPVLHGVDLAVAAGSITALLGASGCGKTTLLRVVAGFERADAGQIAIGGTVAAADGRHVPPERRRVGYVPQEGALFPHLTVAGNVGYGLDRAGRRSGRVEEVLRLTGLSGLAARRPDQLSGGQQQRTALARALAPRPSLVLLDEPFNALDRELRGTVCQDVTRALRAAGATAILVTHDPQEAFACADQVAVMRAGRIVQCGTPEQVYRHPVDPDAARLTGPALLLQGVASPVGIRTVLGPVDAPGPGQVMVRPEQVVPMPGGVAAVVSAVEFRGDHTLVLAEVDGVTVPVRVAEPGGLRPGAVVTLGIRGPCTAFTG